MALEKLSEHQNHLMNLVSLHDQVAEYASRCLPDYVHRSEDGLRFELVEPPLYDHRYVGLTFAHKDESAKPYLFTDWSRRQLLSRLGTTEKWFQSVSDQIQLDELNLRRHCLEGMKVKTLRGDPDLDPLVIRGMVSEYYTDILDLDIMKSLMQCFAGTDPKVLCRYSGKSDRAFYCYVVANRPIEIPKTNFGGYAGLVVRNSEVGYTSLSVSPFLYVPARRSVAVISNKNLLRRIHRGKVNDLKEKFDAAIESAQKVWDDFVLQVPRLANLLYVTQAEAVEKMQSLLLSCGASQDFIGRAETAYKALPAPQHTALNIFEAVLEVVEQDAPDTSYNEGSLAGALLYRLVMS